MLKKDTSVKHIEHTWISVQTKWIWCILLISVCIVVSIDTAILHLPFYILQAFLVILSPIFYFNSVAKHIYMCEWYFMRQCECSIRVSLSLCALSVSAQTYMHLPNPMCVLFYNHYTVITYLILIHASFGQYIHTISIELCMFNAFYFFSYLYITIISSFEIYNS